MKYFLKKAYKFDLETVKTVTFALIHFSVAFTVTYLLTGELLIASLVSLIEPSLNSIAYFFHEKIWARLLKRAPKQVTEF